MKNLIKLSAFSLALIPIQLHAATGNVPFNGSITASCTITVSNPGSLGVNAGSTVLGSSEAGGTSSVAQVVATGTGYSLSTDALSAFSTFPTTGGDNVTFATSFSGSGANTMSNVSSASLTTAGVTNVTVDMQATKSSGVFVAGSYAATVILRCE